MTETLFKLESVQKVIGLETIDSTQTAARLLAPAQAHGTLILACQQTAAFDRENKTFPATEGGVYFTLILKPSKEISLEKLTQAAANAVAETLKIIFELKIKTTETGNILAWDKASRKFKKIAGILAETDENDTYLLGTGIFLNNTLPASYKNTHITLKTLIRAETSKELFLDDVLNRFWKEYAFL